MCSPSPCPTAIIDSPSALPQARAGALCGCRSVPSDASHISRFMRSHVWASCMWHCVGGMCLISENP